MPLYEAQVAMWDLDGVLPRDAAINTLYFDDAGVTSDPDGLAGDLADMYLTHLRAVPVEVKLYDVAQAKPRDVKGHATRNMTSSGSTGSIPREVALCLSYYAGTSHPRNRGRIFLPIYLMSGIGGTGQRPTDPQMQAILAFATQANASFPDIGGPDVRWMQYSRTLGRAAQVTAGWVDDEWDTVRSRGLKPTHRVTFAREG